MTRAAVDAAADQPGPLLGHAYRTWAFGSALAAVDRTSALDAELFFVAALLHDVGLVEAVTGEDFTLRSGQVAARVMQAYAAPEQVTLVQDAIAAHITPGIEVGTDGPEAFYLQAGATLDLGGLRLHHVPERLVEAVLAEHPRSGLTSDIVPRIVREADAVPDGRFAVLRRSGFTLAIRLAPLPG